MDAFGPRPRLVEMAERIAERGYLVLTPHLFYRAGRAPLFDLSRLGEADQRGALFAKIMPLVGALTPESISRDTAAFLDFLAARDDVRPGPVAITGYCMGGTNALRAIEAHPDRIAAVASFHGGRIVTEAPDSPHRGVGSITGEVYFGHADADQSMTPEQIATLEKALDAAGVRYRSEVYTGRTTATPWPTPRRTTSRPPSVTGPPCSTSWTAPCPPADERAGPISGAAAPGRRRSRTRNSAYGLRRRSLPALVLRLAVELVGGDVEVARRWPPTACPARAAAGRGPASRTRRRAAGAAPRCARSRSGRAAPASSDSSPSEAAPRSPWSTTVAATCVVGDAGVGQRLGGHAVAGGGCQRAVVEPMAVGGDGDPVGAHAHRLRRPVGRPLHHRPALDHRAERRQRLGLGGRVVVQPPPAPPRWPGRRR